MCAKAGANYTLAGLQPGAALQSDKRGGLKEKGTSCYCGASNDTRVYVSSSSPFLARKGKESTVLCQDRLGTTRIMRTPQQNDRFSQGVRLVRPVTAACAVRKRRRKQNSLFGTHFRTNSVCACPEPVLARSSRFSRDERLLNKTHLLPFRFYRVRNWDTRRPGVLRLAVRRRPDGCVRRWQLHVGGELCVQCYEGGGGGGGGGRRGWLYRSSIAVDAAAAAAAWHGRQWGLSHGGCHQRCSCLQPVRIQRLFCVNLH